MQPARGDGSSSARARLKREPVRIRAWRRRWRGRAHRACRRLDSEEIDAMPLHERVGEIFLANESAEAQAPFPGSLVRFRVPDRGTDRNQLRVVLLVESPHTDEVRPPEIDDRYPLAGSAGRIVKNKLMDCRLNLPEQPNSIGQLVHDRHNAVQALGIMNVSGLPFQVDPYIRHNNGVRQTRCWGDYITCMNFIRNNPKTINYQGVQGGHLKTEINRLQCAIVDDLRRRLRILHGRSPCVLLVRCGDVAQAFYGKTGITMLHTCNLPHPTNRGSGGELWRNLNCEVPPLQGIINLLWPNPT